jgi:hypothetical protein
MDARIPEKLSLAGNITDNFKRFKQNFEIYLAATEKDKKDGRTKVNILLNIIGEEGVEIFNSLNLSDQDNQNYEKVIEEFEKYVTPKKNEVYERFVFYCRKQEQEERFEHFLTDLRRLAKSCDFKISEEEMIRDRIVLGVNNKIVQEKLLAIDKLTLQRAISVCRSYEATMSQMKELHGQGQELKIDVVKQKSNQKTQKEPTTKKNEIFKCKRCETKHKARECPAYGKKCHKCGKLNHFQIACKTKQVHNIDQDENEEEEDQLYVGTIRINKIGKKQKEKDSWYEQIEVEGQKVKIKLDTGADTNLIPLKIFQKISHPQKLVKTRINLEAYGGYKLKVVGKAELECKIHNKESRQTFIVVNENGETIMGKDACESLKLIQKIGRVEESKTGRMTSQEAFIRKNEESFEGLGKFKENCHLTLKGDSKPVFSPARRIPLAIKDKVKVKLEELERKGIITREENPTGWASPLVIVEKPDGSLRLCMDPHELNKVLEKPSYMIPTLEEIKNKLNEKKYYSVFDLKDGYYQVGLDEESRNLCKINTPFGCFKFNRLPFGLNIAPEYFQMINTRNFRNIPNTIIYFDDILIATKTEEEHDQIVQQVIERAKEMNIKFNKKKLQYKRKEVKFLGLIFKAEGMTLDQERINAIECLENPQNKSELQRLLGIFNFVRQFIPNYAELTMPLRELLKKNNKFAWMEEHTRVLKKMKEKLTKGPVLANFDIKKKITIQADASKSGIGCCLLQEGKPVSFASRALSEAETRYAQIEKEFLSIVFATTKFHQYIYGFDVEVLTDHKPLVSIMKKEINKIHSSRLQRMRLKLVKYKLNVKYLPGKYMYIADLLSRDYKKNSAEEDKELVEIVHTVSVHARISPDKREEFQRHTQKDEDLQKVMKYIKNGWPKEIKKVEPQLRTYWKIQEELQEIEGIIFKQDQLVVPKTLRKEMMKLLHQPHFGITKTKLRAKEVFYWPFMNNEITLMVENCKLCAKYQPAKQKEPLILHSIPKTPFAKLGMDILEHLKKDYLVIMDYYSKWLEVVPLQHKTAREIITKCEAVFTTHGIPSEVIADNVPFGSAEFREFAKKWNFKVNTSSPHYPKSNGQAEKGVHIAKMLLKKADNLNLALLEYRNTPIPQLKKSPAQILCGRRMKTNIPINEKLLQEEIQDSDDYFRRLQAKRQKYKQYYDRTAKDQEEFSPNDDVVIRDGKTWTQGHIVGQHQSPRSYIVKSEKGEVRRNSSFLKKAKQLPEKHNTKEDTPRVTEPNPETQSSEETSASNDCNRERVKRCRDTKPPAKFQDYVLY